MPPEAQPAPAATARHFLLPPSLGAAADGPHTSAPSRAAEADPAIARALSDKKLKATVFFPQDKAFTDFLKKNVRQAEGEGPAC